MSAASTAALIRRRSCRLKGKTAIVTGGSRGIGRAIAEKLAQRGASVVVNYTLSSAAASEVAQAITKAGGKAIAVQADVSKPADVKRLFAETRLNGDIPAPKSRNLSGNMSVSVNPWRHRVDRDLARGQFVSERADKLLDRTPCCPNRLRLRA